MVLVSTGGPEYTYMQWSKKNKESYSVQEDGCIFPWRETKILNLERRREKGMHSRFPASWRQWLRWKQNCSVFSVYRPTSSLSFFFSLKFLLQGTKMSCTFLARGFSVLAPDMPAMDLSHDKMPDAPGYTTCLRTPQVANVFIWKRGSYCAKFRISGDRNKKTKQAF